MCQCVAMGVCLNKFKVLVLMAKDKHAINDLLYVSLLEEQNSGQNFKHDAFRKLKKNKMTT